MREERERKRAKEEKEKERERERKRERERERKRAINNDKKASPKLNRLISRDLQIQI